MNELLSKLPDLKQNISLTKDTLNKFYKSLRDESDKLKRDKSKYTSTPIRFLSKYPDDLKIPLIDFIDTKIYIFLDKSNGFYQQLNITIAKRSFIIHLYLPSENSNTRDKHVADYFQDCIHKVLLWLHFISPYIRSNCSMKSHIYLLFTHFQKMIPSHNEPITYKHVNSAFTTSCLPETSIYIFRDEEWFKVLIHECFHCFGLDFSHYDNYEVENKILNTFKVHNKNGIRVYEAYVEVWADVLNIVFLSFIKTKDKKNYINLFEHLINKELSFSLFQCTKILDHMNLSYGDIIDAKRKSIKYEETCNLTSYYFLKLILFLNLQQFESWCKKHNLSLFVFNENNMIKFVDFIATRANTHSLQKCLQIMKAFSNRAKLTNIAKKTMKMTIIK
jgi:hypothetical protein